MAEFKVGSLVAAEGTKVQGYLEVPGTPVKMPITLINGVNEGKTVVITGGTHGGEYPGVETSIRLAKTLDPQEVSGQIAIVHPVNVPAFALKRRTPCSLSTFSVATVVPEEFLTVHLPSARFVIM